MCPGRVFMQMATRADVLEALFAVEDSPVWEIVKWTISVVHSEDSSQRFLRPDGFYVFLCCFLEAREHITPVLLFPQTCSTTIVRHSIKYDSPKIYQKP